MNNERNNKMNSEINAATSNEMENGEKYKAVSYTHLTLPTILRV